MIDPVTIGVIGTIAVFVLLFLGMPIAFALMLVGFSGISMLASVDAALPKVASTVWEVSSFYPYTVIPLFIVMGGFASSSGLTSEMYGTFDKWMRRLPGGLAIATIGACGGFSAVSGSSVATAAAMGTVALPEMKRFNYKSSLAAGSVAAGGTLGFLIPPSIGFVVYGMITEQSIGKLLVAGMLPGVVLGLAYVGIVIAWVKMYPDAAPTSPERVTWAEKFASLKGVWEPLVLFMVVMGGIYAGFFTPTEAGAVGATVLFLVALIKRRLSWQVLIGALIESVRISVMVLFLVAGANVFSYFLALSTIPTQVAGWAASLDVSPYLIHTVIILIYLFLGCFLDAISMMVLTLPVIYPIITALHFDPIWFGVIAVLMMEAGLITPPMGLNIFTVAGVSPDIKLETIFKGVAPFLLAIFFVAFLITVIPGIATLLPNMMTR
ncbi:C4-dicarboxylate ABC transporter permease [Desulfoferula mesophila]|uniref:C4-dicarboxylate ABC transporter permease n=2 Tax=Desulfoferula mesophila TaxID=3058419 RepID=A0AAU9F2Z8_9BACT|nr:C4-dicarboxylate ABC transporter permease [Desulfoferula mesophilus]